MPPRRQDTVHQGADEAAADIEGAEPDARRPGQREAEAGVVRRGVRSRRSELKTGCYFLRHVDGHVIVTESATAAAPSPKWRTSAFWDM